MLIDARSRQGLHNDVIEIACNTKVVLETVESEFPRLVPRGIRVQNRRTGEKRSVKIRPDRICCGVCRLNFDLQLVPAVGSGK